MFAFCYLSFEFYNCFFLRKSRIASHDKVAADGCGDKPYVAGRACRSYIFRFYRLHFVISLKISGFESGQAGACSVRFLVWNGKPVRYHGFELLWLRAIQRVFIQVFPFRQGYASMLMAILAGPDGAMSFTLKRAELTADRKSTRLNSSHSAKSRMPSSA